MIDRITQLLTEGANIVFDFRAFRTLGIVKAINTTAMDQIFINPVKHDIGHLRITDQMVAVVAIFIELMKVDIIEAGAAV